MFNNFTAQYGGGSQGTTSAAAAAEAPFIGRAHPQT